MATPSSVVVLSQTSQSRVLRLRYQAEKLQNDVEVKVEEQMNDFKAKYHNASDEDLQNLIDNAFIQVRVEINNNLDKMQAEVKSHAPKKPVKKPGQSEVDFQKTQKKYEDERSDYIKYVAFVTDFLAKLRKMFDDVCNKILEFFSSLWNWIKQKLQDLGKRISEFFQFLKEKISNGLASLFP